MAIVYYDRNNSRYAYESISKWDPVRKKVRPQRRYLGKVNVDTGEIIPTSKVRGGVRINTPPPNDGEAVTQSMYQDAQDRLAKADRRISELEQQVAELVLQKRRTERVLSGIRKQLDSLDIPE